MTILSHYVIKLFVQLFAIISLISRLIKRSLASGTVPLKLKTAADTLILRKLCLGPSVLSNYRPITNHCPTVFRAVSPQLEWHQVFFIIYTSLSKQNNVLYIAETSLHRAINDLFLSAESGVFNIQLLLDLKSLWILSLRCWHH